jgi:hypothetical protein
MKTIIKTQSPETIDGKIVSHPSGDNPWHLMSVEQVSEGLENDVVEDTADFLAQFDLSNEDEEDLESVAD